MVNSKRNKLISKRAWRRLPQALQLGVLLTSGLCAATLKQSAADINMESDGGYFDALTKQMVLPKVRIWQDGYEIQADEARAQGLGFDDNQWTFTGKVRITTPQGSSSADRAVVKFVQNQITELHINGQPATFEQRDASKQLLAQGQAGLIDYDLEKNTVRLSNNAWIKYGDNEFRGKVVVYDINNKRALANPEEQQGERVRITITPKKSSTSSSAGTPQP